MTTQNQTNPFENAETARQYVAMDKSHHVKHYSLYPTILGLLGDVKGKNLIDIGCGDGNFARALIDAGAYQVLACDDSPEMMRTLYEIRNREISAEHIPSNGITPFRCNAEFLPNCSSPYLDVATAILFFNYIRTRESLDRVCKRIYNNLKEGGKFIAFQNQIEDAHFRSGKVGNVNYIEEGCNETGQLLWKLTRENKDGRLIELELTDWTQFNYESALKEAGFRNIKWHSPIVSQEGMDTMGNNFWADFFKAGLYRGFEAVK